MKQAKIKTIAILTFLLITLLTMVFAVDWSIKEPDNGQIILTQAGNNIMFTVNMTPDSGYNITELNLLSNHTGTWQINQTYNLSHVAAAQADIEVARTFEVNASAVVSDGLVFIFGFNGSQINNSVDNTSKTNYSENRTATIQFAPTVTLNAPTTNTWHFGDNDSVPRQITFDLNYVGNYTTDLNGQCRIWTNESGSFAVAADFGLIVNNTNTNFSYQFANDGSYLYNIQCWEQSDQRIYDYLASNRTIHIDSILPVVVINHTNATWTNNRTQQLNYTATDTNLDVCQFHLNQSVNQPFSNVNQTHTSLTSGTTDGFQTNLTDANYTYYVACNDSSNSWANSSIFELRADFIFPGVTKVENQSRKHIQNNSVIKAYADHWMVNITTSEPTTLTVDFGNTTSTVSSVIESSLLREHLANLTDQLEDTTHYFNVTACDVAGNCNRSMGQFTYRFPFALATGWTVLGIYENRINMTEIINQTDVEFVYYFNESPQSWAFASRSTTNNYGFDLNYGDVVFLYTSGNRTWFQNRTQTGYFNKNLSSGHNYFAATENARSIGNISISFANATNTFADLPEAGSPINGTNINLTFWNSHNNSKRLGSGQPNAWDVNFIRNWSTYNNTIVNKSSGLEAVWVFSPNDNFTTLAFQWNGTAIEWYNGSEYVR